MDQSTIEAVSILSSALDQITPGERCDPCETIYACHVLYRAIQHLARPDRIRQPKLRGQRKTSRRVAC